MAYPHPDRFYRTLVKLVSIELDLDVGSIFQVVIPSWGDKQIPVLAASIPDDIRLFVNENFVVGEDMWLIVKVNLSVRFVSHLIFKDWEFAPKIDEIDDD
jgi:hypothetical protein